MLALRIAMRYLLARKSHTAVNVISMISVAGIAVAAMAMVCVMSVFNGFTQLASERLSAIDPDIRITEADGKVMASGDSLAKVVAGVEGVRTALPTLEQKALALYSGVQMPVTVRGVPGGYSATTALHTLVIDGVAVDPDPAENDNYALLSVGAAISTGARPGVEVPFYLTVPRRLGRINPAFPMAAFRTDTLFVSGVYQTNQAEYDEDMVYIPLESARRLFDYDTEASAIEVALDKDVDPDQIAATISKVLGPGYIVADRLRQQEASFRMIAIEKWITFVMLLFVLVMASFNILATMSMLIIEKEENLIILRAMGASRRMVRRIFQYEGVLIAVAGGIAGILAGMVLCLLQQHFGLISLGGDHSQMSIVAYPCRLDMADVAVTAAVVLAIGFLSGLVSSRSVPE